MSTIRQPWERVTHDPAIVAAFEAVDRRDFLDLKQARAAMEDRPLPIGHRQTNSQPSTVAQMLVYLEVQPGHHVLDVGTGSGWTTALLGHLVGPSGSVTGVELVPELARSGAANLAKYEMPWASITTATPGSLGAPAKAPFDRILVSAEATSLPAELVAQLKPDGLMVIPVAGEMTVVRRRRGEADEVTRHGRYSFVPLL